MTPERWRQVDALFQAALDYKGEQRAAFLDAACGADQELRREIDSLLAAHETAPSFLEQPAYEQSAAGLPSAADEPAASLIGQRIGPYQVLEEIGRGGMGEVYLAIR